MQDRSERTGNSRQYTKKITADLDLHPPEMRFTTLLLPLLSLPLLAIASSAEHWATLASKSKDGVIKLDSQSYDDLLSADRDYSVSVVLTALPAQFKCQPCQYVFERCETRRDG